MLLRCEILSKQVTNRNNDNFKLGNRSLKEFYNNAETAILGRRNIEDENNHELTKEAKDILTRDLASVNISIYEAGIAQLKYELSNIISKLHTAINQLGNGQALPSIMKGVNDFIHTSNFKGSKTDIPLDWLINSDLNADKIINVAKNCVKHDKWYKNLKDIFIELQNSRASRYDTTSSLNPNPLNGVGGASSPTPSSTSSSDFDNSPNSSPNKPIFRNAPLKLQRQKEEAIKIHICPFCPESYASPGELISHRYSYHKIPRNSNVNRIGTYEVGDDDLWYCSIDPDCIRQFGVARYALHLRDYHKLPIDAIEHDFGKNCFEER